MAFPPKQCLRGILILLSIMFSFSHAKAQPCKCHDSDQDRLWSNYTTQGSDFFVMDKEAGDFRILNDSDVNNTHVLSYAYGAIQLLQFRPDGKEVDEASFRAAIAYQSPLWNRSTSIRGGFTFVMLPSRSRFSTLEQLLSRDVGPLNLTGNTASGSTVSVGIGVLSSSNLTITKNYSQIMVVDITIDPVSAAVVWIDYDRAVHSLLVYADGLTKPIAEVPLDITSFPPYFAFFLLSTAEQVRSSRVRWNATIEHLPQYNGLPRKVTILSSVLGSVGATGLMAVGLACYFNSRYRRWHKDLDQLARSMERLPGMPTKVEFTDIKKATSNFHEATKLGGGGFGTVYRCTLPAAASKMERTMDVAVKRFTRDVQNHRYDDFLAEVSIINRLRHKNIVPLIGWSYNKGEPLLVFEFMTNGSLDQHLFPRGGDHTRQRDTDAAAIQQWATRYEIVRDVATGLHYVHHEYEPMVLHCDIKASNVMLDSSFRARLGDFGLACTVAVDRNSATVYGGYIAPEYGMFGKATRQTDIYALGVLILEVVTGQQVLIHRAADDDNDVHITDRVWRLHREGRLLVCVDPMLIPCSSPEEDSLHAGGDAERLLLLGLACSSPNPSDRPTMPEVVQVIAKSTTPPEVPLMKPRFVWPPPEGAAWDGDDSGGTSMTSKLEGSMASTAERQSQWLTAAAQRRATGVHASFQLEPSVYVTVPSALDSGERPSRA